MRALARRYEFIEVRFIFNTEIREVYGFAHITGM